MLLVPSEYDVKSKLQEETMTTHQTMRGFIEVVNRLQDVLTVTGLNLGLQLPQIVVVGGQSSGKSSVLEGFVGRDFLPRGSGIVTTRPLVLQLYNSQEEYGQFLHIQKRFTDFKEIRDEIWEQMNSITNVISDIPVNLKIFSPNVLDLTLIDLPGLIKVPLNHQPPDLETRIRGIVLKYICEQNTIILAVTPANQDLANSDALKIAREVDPNGQRTIGVLTKLDLMDTGTDARIILENQLLPLQKGYIGVVNRSQKDIDQDLGLTEALSKEREFLVNHPSYRHITDRLGIPYLQQFLSKELMTHVRNKLPEIRSKLLQRLQSIRCRLRITSGSFDPCFENKDKMLYRIMNVFQEQLSSVLEGNSIRVDMKSVQGGSLINRTFYSEIQELLDIDTSPDLLDIAVTIKNFHGIRCSLFLPEMVFDRTVKQLIGRYEEPLLKSVDLITSHLMRIIETCAKAFDHFPRLYQEVLLLLTQHLHKQDLKCKEMLLTHVQAEACYMNTRHPEFKVENMTLGSEMSAEMSDDYEVTKKKMASNKLPQKPILQGNLVLYSQGFRKQKKCFVVLQEGQMFVYKDEQPDSVQDAPDSGIFEPNNDGNIMLFKDSNLRVQAQLIANIVRSYMSIIDKTIRDITPKYITLTMIHDVLKYVRENLLADLLANRNDLESKELLMQGNSDDFRELEELNDMLEVTKNALALTTDIII